jgi:hypothetical protein
MLPSDWRQMRMMAGVNLRLSTAVLPTSSGLLLSALCALRLTSITLCVSVTAVGVAAGVGVSTGVALGSSTP